MSGFDDEKNALWPLKMYRYRHSTGRWKHLPKDYHSESSSRRPAPAPNRIKILTWNLCAPAPHAIERMQGAVTFMQEVLEDPPVPCVILLQEVAEGVLPYLLEIDWVQRFFLVTPASKVKWNGEGRCGLVTLVEKSVPVLHSSIVHFAKGIVTDQERALVLTDVKLRVPGPIESGEEELYIVVRVANVHLESMRYRAEMRRMQLRFCSWIVQNEDEKYPFDGGVIAGDFNAIDPDSDYQVVEERLVDAIGIDLVPAMQKGEQNTWGINGPTRGGFPPGRLDKIVFTPNRGFRVTTPERVGVGLMVESRAREVLVSDHCGLLSDLEVQRNG